MYTITKKNLYVVSFCLAVFAVFIIIWFLFFRSASPSNNTLTGSFFGTPVNTSTTVTNTSASNINGGQTITSQQTASQKIFEIAQGPIAGATLIQTLHPTTTLARYINQEDGHVYDLPLDVPGAVPRVVSNITIPGAERVIWVEQGSAAILQYLDSSTIKSVYLGFPTTTTSTNILPTHIQFLPDNIIDLAASPDGVNVTYLLKTSSGSDGYIARSDGTGAKKVFSLPLSQVLVSWTTQSTLLVQTKSAAGVPGIAFSVDVKSGAVTPLVYAQGLTAIANKTFSTVIYQVVSSDSLTRSTYSRNIQSGGNVQLFFNPSPEKCTSGILSATILFCATSLQPIPSNYLDVWHQGLYSAVDSIFSFNIANNSYDLLATPGSSNGGVSSDILEMALSPDEHYLSFTTKGARSLWGVRLAQ
jgi:hypothetical protein